MRTRAVVTLIVASLATLVLLLISGWHPYDRATWLMEVAPIMIALPVLWLTYGRFPLTSLLYICIFIHAVVLAGITGGDHRLLPPSRSPVAASVAAS